MNNFGDFLYELRKEKRITQVELADKLGVSNKAVSKWETGEAMPETSLLIPISKIFDVTVDELLNGKRVDEKRLQKEESSSSENKEEKSDFERFDASKHLFTRGKDEEEKTLLDVISGIVCGGLVLFGIATYLILGVLKGLWYPYWVIIPCCALGCGIVSIVFSFFNRKRCQKKLSHGENPYTGGVCGIVMLVCIITYLIIGVTLNLWHPYWIICACGGLTCGVIGSVGNLFTYKNKNKYKDKED